MKKIGIVVDNYKLDYYKDKLIEKGFEVAEVSDYTKNCKLISVYVRSILYNDSVRKINLITSEGELLFKKLKNANNSKN